MKATPCFEEKIFGLGLSRTGTTSLASALEQLDIRTVHYPSDPTTFADAMAVIDRPSVRSAFPTAARQVLERGYQGEIPETPKPDSPSLGRSVFEVIGSRTHAVRAAAQVAAELGYAVATIDSPVVGAARDAARAHHQEVLRLAMDL